MARCATIRTNQWFAHLTLLFNFLSLSSPWREWDMLGVFLPTRCSISLFFGKFLAAWSSKHDTWSPDVTHRPAQFYLCRGTQAHACTACARMVCVRLRNMWRQFLTADSFSFEIETPLWIQWLLITSSHIVAEQILPSHTRLNSGLMLPPASFLLFYTAGNYHIFDHIQVLAFPLK